ncbi:MAG: zf-TFIIB domain-containing protein [Oscillospiraceae bacterium]|nr:zf-TFIIB domain-containing protein [Oscillospiraceae bacterium]
MTCPSCHGIWLIRAEGSKLKIL